MDALGITAIAVPTLPRPVSRAAAVLPKPAPAPELPVPAEFRPAEFDAKAAEQQRLQAVRRASEAIANVYIVGDKRFTIFKDVTGQYITRFTDLRSGNVTYIPEPQLLKHTSAAPILSITA